MTKSNKPQKASRSGYGILNPYGDMWTPTLFDSEKQAEEYLRAFWSGSRPPVDLTRYKIVWAKQVTSFVSPERPAEKTAA